MQRTATAFASTAATVSTYWQKDALVVELKSVEEVKGIHEAQLLTYMKLAGVKTGLLINFNVTKLKTGIKRFVL